MRNGYQLDLQNYDHVKPYSYDYKVWLIYASTILRPAISFKLNIITIFQRGHRVNI